jgi:hypothetical protein
MRSELEGLNCCVLRFPPQEASNAPAIETPVKIDKNLLTFGEPRRKRDITTPFDLRSRTT